MFQFHRRLHLFSLGFLPWSDNPAAALGGVQACRQLELLPSGLRLKPHLLFQGQESVFYLSAAQSASFAFGLGMVLRTAGSSSSDSMKNLTSSDMNRCMNPLKSIRQLDLRGTSSLGCQLISCCECPVCPGESLLCLV